MSTQVRHPLSERFHQLLREIGELHDRKQADYGSDQDPFANVNQAKEWGIEPWVAATLRAGEKLQRLKAFVKNGSLANESVVDSLKDLSVYGLIALVLYENRLVHATISDYKDYFTFSELASTKGTYDELDDFRPKDRRKHVRGHRRAKAARRTRRKHR